jgi:deoxyribonuclease-4
VPGGPPAPRLGAHLSIRGGLHRAVERAAELRATALQLFVKSARQWSAPRLGRAEVALFRERLGASGLADATLAHASYLINLAAPDPATWRRSIHALADELERCDRLGIRYLVVHPGSHVGSGETRGLERVVEALGRLPRGTPGAAGTRRAALLLETTAGQGSNLGYRFEQLGRILRRARAPRRLGVCFDTCHALAAGYEFREPRAYRRTFREFDAAVGLRRLAAFHLNDSVGALGSRKDRHAHIGGGELGLEAFRMILHDRRFAGLPMVLETPKGEDSADDRRNLARLRRLARGTRAGAAR